MELSSLERHHELQKRETLNGSHPQKLLKQKTLSCDHDHEAQYIVNQQQQLQQQQQLLQQQLHANNTNHNNKNNVLYTSNGDAAALSLQQQLQQQQLQQQLQQQQQQNHVSTQEIQRTAFARAHFRHVAVRGLIGK